MTVATTGVKLALVMLAAMAALNLFAEGEPKMPTLNWMGREKATKSVKDVIMKILREDSARGQVAVVWFGRQCSCAWRQPGGAEGAVAVLCRAGEVHLHRPAVQHRLRVRALRRQPRTLHLAQHDVPAPQAPARFHARGRQHLDFHR